MIVVTGAAGFIASNLIKMLNDNNFNGIVAVDDFSKADKASNFSKKKIQIQVPRESFHLWLDQNYKEVEFIFHLGARTDTTETDYSVFQTLNLEYSKKIWQQCVQYQIPLIYASSAATYGNGSHGYDDNESKIPNLLPLNPYGESKNNFDIWALNKEHKPFYWAGLKFFNVYGPNEYHKGRMASVVYHSFSQIQKTGSMKLFRSHHPNFKDGEQMRDFVYVKDVCSVLYWLMHHRQNSGIYNLGSGQARTFNDLVSAVFNTMGLAKNTSYIDTPIDIRDNYQYFTEASMMKLQAIGYKTPFTSLENGVEDYVKNYLHSTRYN